MKDWQSISESPFYEKANAYVEETHNNDCTLEAFIDGAESRQAEIAELEELIEKYRQAVDKCLHITFVGGGCEVNTIGQYATLVDGYLTDVEGLAKWKK